MKKTVINFLIITLLAGFCAACSSKPPELKSPCVGIEGSPCERRPANRMTDNG